MEVTASVSVEVDGDTLFAYVGNPEKLVQYLPLVTGVHRNGSEVRATVHRAGPQAQTIEGFWRVLPDRHLEWGSNGGGYRGEAAIVTTDRDSLLVVTLNVPDGDYVAVNRELEEALARIKGVVEGGGRGRLLN
jgi:hypothetical protein